MFREVIGIPSFYVMLYRARQGHVQPRRHCKHKRDKNPDNPAWSLGCCSLTREVLSSIAEYRSPDLSPGIDSVLFFPLPMDPQFEADEIAITPLGPRGRDWLYEPAQEGNKGKDFFAWWTPGFNAEYYLGR